MICCAVAVSCTNDSNDSDSDDEDQIPTPVFVDITFNSSAAVVSIPDSAIGVSCESGTSTDVVLTLDSAVTTEYIYRVKGNSASGSLTINSNYKLTLLLAGLDLTSTTATPPLHINCGKRIAVILQEDTDNSLTDNALNDKKGAFYTKGHLEFQGGGTLNITGNARHALCAKEYIQLKKSTGTINILGAVNDGIHCGKGDGDPENNYFKMNGGILNFSNVGSDLIDCDDYGNAYINGGTLNLTVEASDGKGLKADSVIYMSDGTINLDIEGVSAIGIQSNYTADFSGGTITGTVAGYKGIGIKGNDSKSSLTVLDGGDLCFSGSKVNISLTGSGSYGIYTEKDLTVTGGTVTLSGPASLSPGYRSKGDVSGTDYLIWTETTADGE